MIGFSTAVLGRARGRGAAVVAAARELGLNLIELGANLECDPPESLAGALHQAGIQVVSLHNVVSSNPSAAAGADSHLFVRGDPLTDTAPAAAARGFELTLGTARMGAALGAPRVVLHAGTFASAELEAIKKRAEDLFRREGRTLEVKRLIASGLDLVRPQRAAFLERAVRVLYDLLKAAPDTTFCLETRYHFYEAPDFEMMELILDDLKSPRLCYWHDTGHAHAQDVLGLCDHQQWLDRFGRRTAGVHLHDAAGLDDHLPPGSGEIDFKAVNEALPAGAVRILEISPDFGVEGAAMGLAELRKLKF